MLARASRAPRPATSTIDARKAEERARHVGGAQALARQERREQHDQERPEIGDEARLRRRREAQGREVEGVVAEQPADPERPHDSGLPQGAAALRAGDQVATPTSPPTRNVIAASWNGGTLPDAAVNRASRDQSRTATRPVAVAARVVIGRP